MPPSLAQQQQQFSESVMPPSSPPYLPHSSDFFTDQEDNNLDLDPEIYPNEDGSGSSPDDSLSSDYPTIQTDSLGLDCPHGYVTRKVTRMDEATRAAFAKHAKLVGTVRLKATHIHVPSSAPATQHRRPRRTWTAEEVGALELYIRRWGTSWARIKHYDDGKKFGASFLGGRSQGDLKNKARNIKYHMLRCGYPLHENFRGVCLEVKKKEALKKYGVVDLWE
jgi:hypothetical protein